MSKNGALYEEDKELDDFDSRPFWKPNIADHSYLKGMWGDFRANKGTKTSASLAKDTITAHGMVQSFVNAFARDGHYVVVFDPQTETAGTDMKARLVVITPAPIADLNLTAEEAGLILTGLAVHEISHPRYGKDTADAVERTFPRNSAASRLSNLLDDIRIERRFIGDYPGYSGIFQPTLDYVGARGTDGGKKLRVPSLDQPVNLAIAATRYSAHSEWTDPAVIAEFKWWNAWADRWAFEDAPARHVAAIREALAHIVNVEAAPPPPVKMKGSGAGDNSESSAEDGDGAPESGPGDEMIDGQLNRATTATEAFNADRLDSCSGSKAVDRAAEDGDTTAGEIRNLKEEAQEIVEAARNVESDGHGNKVDVNLSTRGLISTAPALTVSESASRQIRNAIIQSRTGHMAIEPFKRTGRLDQKGLARIAHGDYRTFEKRVAPSPGKYLVWVMVDCSISMSGTIRQAATVAAAIAAATNSLPTVRMAVWGWTNSFRSNDADAGVARVWETGMKVRKVFELAALAMDGTPDATVMGWTSRAITKAAHADEKPVIIFISDGEGESTMNKRVEEAREMGVIVVSVSFGHGFSETAQVARFGEGNCVPFQGSIEKTAKPLARMLMKIVTKGATR